MSSKKMHWCALCLIKLELRTVCQKLIVLLSELWLGQAHRSLEGDLHLPAISRNPIPFKHEHQWEALTWGYPLPSYRSPFPGVSHCHWLTGWPLWLPHPAPLTASSSPSASSFLLHRPYKLKPNDVKTLPVKPIGRTFCLSMFRSSFIYFSLDQHTVLAHSHSAGVDCSTV